MVVVVEEEEEEEKKEKEKKEEEVVVEGQGLKNGVLTIFYRPFDKGWP